MARKISSLPIDAKVKFGKYQVETETPQPIIWQIAGKNHVGYPTNSVTLITEKIIDVRAFDGIEATNPNSNRASGGNGRYLHSNIRQWLNKDNPSWYVAAHGYDTPPNNANTKNYNTGYDTKAGFLSNFTQEEKALILPTSLTVVRSTITDGGGSDTLTDKVFLLSTTEVGLSNENSIAEGNKLEYFVNKPDRLIERTEQCLLNSKSTSMSADYIQYWLRTPQYNHTSAVRYDSVTGGGTSSASFGYMGIRPALNVSDEILVSDNVDVDGCYIQTFNDNPIISGEDSHLGKKTSSFSIEYTINDLDQADTIIINEKLDGSILKTIDNAVRDQTYILSVDNIHLLTDGSHTVTIEAIDSYGNKSIRTYTFEKIKSLPPNAKIKDIITELEGIEMLNGKSEIINTLGEPFTIEDSPITIVSNLQNIKNNMANSLTNKGTNSVSTESLNTLANKFTEMSNIKSIQVVEQAFNINNSLNITINPINIDNSVVLLDFYVGGSNAIYNPVAKITNSTTITISSNSSLSGSGITYNLKVTVIDFNNVKSVQRGETIKSTNSPNNITITPVNVLKSLVFCKIKPGGGNTSNGVDSSYGILTATDNLKIFNSVVFNGASNTFVWQIIEFN